MIRSSLVECGGDCCTTKRSCNINGTNGQSTNSSTSSLGSNHSNASTCINHKSSPYDTIQTLIVVNGRLGAKGCPATLPILHPTELFQSASLSSITCKLLSTMYASLRLLQRVHGGWRSGRGQHLIFCLRQATQAVILRLTSGSFRSPKCSRGAFEDWPSMAAINGLDALEAS